MRDPQRARVYAWEGDFADWNADTIKLKTCRAYVHWACALYGLRPPAVKSHGGKELSFSQTLMRTFRDGTTAHVVYPRGSVISMQRGQLNRAIVLHETAHYIADNVFGLNAEEHSPAWLAIYLWLLIKARIVPRSALFASARTKKLRWLPLWQVSPRRLARAFKGRRVKCRLKPPAR